MEMQARWENQLLALAGNVPHLLPSVLFLLGRDASLRKAYARAEEITAEHSKSFYLASQLLPKKNALPSAPFTLFAAPWMT